MQKIKKIIRKSNKEIVIRCTECNAPYTAVSESIDVRCSNCCEHQDVLYVAERLLDDLGLTEAVHISNGDDVDAMVGEIQ